jgi:hypothetical protein
MKKKQNIILSLLILSVFIIPTVYSKDDNDNVGNPFIQIWEAITNLEIRVISLEETGSTLEAQLEALETEIASQNNEIESLKTRVTEIEQATQIEPSLCETVYSTTTTYLDYSVTEDYLEDMSITIDLPTDSKILAVLSVDVSLNNPWVYFKILDETTGNYLNPETYLIHKLDYQSATFHCTDNLEAGTHTICVKWSHQYHGGISYAYSRSLTIIAFPISTIP